MKPLARTALQVPPSGIRELMELALKTPGCIHLEIGQPNFDTPDHICEAGIQAIRDGFTGYTSARGIPELREAICQKLAEQNGIIATSENITVCPGSVTALCSSVMALAEPGDEVLTPDPGFPNAEMVVCLMHATPVHYHLRPNRGFLPDVEEIRTKVSSRTKAILLNSPSNPTGAVFPKPLLEDIYQIAKENDLYVISDEIYEDLVFDGKHFSLGRLDADERVISVFGFSKSFSMTGWRIGYLRAPREISAIITKLQEPLVACASSISQRAAVVALLGSRQEVMNMREAYRKRRDLALSILRQFGLYEYTPGGAFYLMVNVSCLGNDSKEIAKRLVEEVKVATAPGTAFGQSMREYIRISLAASDKDIETGLTRICQYMKAKS